VFESIDEADKQTVKVTIAVVGPDADGDGVYETTDAAKTATAGNMVFTYTINDDDAAPFAYFKNIDATASTETGSVEEGETKTITVALSAASERDIVLYYSDNGSGDATTAVDYTAINDYTQLTTITGNLGTNEVTFDVVTTEDDIDEGAGGNDYQTVDIKLYSTTSANSNMGTVSNATAGGGSD
jgi:hypothetical protein